MLLSPFNHFIDENTVFSGILCKLIFHQNGGIGINRIAATGGSLAVFEITVKASTGENGAMEILEIPAEYNLAPDKESGRIPTNAGQNYQLIQQGIAPTFDDAILTDMRYVYSKSDTLQKKEFVNMMPDSNLYYENGIYRTPAIPGILPHNHLKMKEKGLLIYEKKRLYHKSPSMKTR